VPDGESSAEFASEAPSVTPDLRDCNPSAESGPQAPVTVLRGVTAVVHEDKAIAAGVEDLAPLGRPRLRSLAREAPEALSSIAAANNEGLTPEGTIGAILVAAGRISAEDVGRVLAAQLETSAPFGKAAITLGVATTQDIEFALSKQFSMPRLRIDDTSVDPELIAAFHPKHEFVERLRHLRSQIATQALGATPPLRSIAIVGAERGVGRSYITANLAMVFAQLGTRTLLVDADLLNPRQHLLFKLSNRAGLSSILADRANLGAVCQIPGLPGFGVLTAGPTPPNPHDLVARPTLRQFLRRCEQDYELILLDTPAWSEGTSARTAVAAAGAAVILVQTGRTAASDASTISREIANQGAQLLGVVLNRP
jgi:chain length determinant protein tyrosine kinase EpsG